MWDVAIQRCQVAYSLTLPGMTKQTGYRVNGAAQENSPFGAIFPTDEDRACFASSIGLY